MARQNETAAQWRGAEITDNLQAPQARFSDSRYEQEHWPEREERDERSYGRYDIDDDEPQNRQPQSHQWQESRWQENQWQENQWRENQWQDNQQPEPHWQNDYDNRGYAYRDDDRFDHVQNDHRDRRQNGPSELDQDLKAMATVWSMMRQGAVRMLGEIGRQY